MSVDRPDMPSAADSGPRPAGHSIVVGVDGSPGAQAALVWALRHAAAHGAGIEAVMCWSGSLADGEPHPDAVLRDIIAAAAEEAGADPDSVRSSLVAGSPADALLNASMDADLLVVGSRGHGGFVGSLIGSVSHAMVTHAACTVVVVPDVQQREQRAAVRVDREAPEPVAPSQAAAWRAMQSAQLD